MDLRGIAPGAVGPFSASVVATFFSGLKRHTSLETIKMNGVSDEDAERTVYPALKNVLCDKTSTESICNSNHTLSKVEHIGGLFRFLMRGRPGEVESEIESECEALLKMNEGANKAEVARKKIIQYYFINGNNLHELINMGVGLMPRVLEGLGQNGLNVVYELVRVFPSLQCK